MGQSQRGVGSETFVTGEVEKRNDEGGGAGLGLGFHQSLAP